VSRPAIVRYNRRAVDTCRRPVPFQERLPMRRSLIAAIAIALPMLAGCGGGIDERNFSRLRVGMTAQEVEAILGKGGKPVPTDEVAALMREALAPAGKTAAAGPKADAPDLSGFRGVRWGDDTKSITVIYNGDRVSRLFKKGI
jgi:hypothetical protein